MGLSVVMRSRMEAKLAWNGEFLYAMDNEFFSKSQWMAAAAHRRVITAANSGKTTCTLER
jgi:hypothetical protein